MNTRQIDIIKEDCSKALSDPNTLSEIKNDHILVTGGTGFIGSWIAELVAYLNDTYNFETQLTLLARNAYKFNERAPHLASRNTIHLVDSDVRSDLEVPEDCSWVIHLAGTPDNRVHASDPLGVMDCIINGTSQVLHASSRLPNLKKFLNASSGLIYGSQPWELERIPESYLGSVDCSSASSAYSEAKRSAETLCNVYRSQFQLPIVNVRPFAFVGPYQFGFSGPYHLLERPWAINNFIHRSLQGGSIRITCDEDTVRSYMYPSDLAYWLLRILVGARSGMTFNVGSPHGYTLRQVAETVASCFTEPPNIESPAPQRNLMRSKFVPDVARAKDSLGLELTVGFEAAVKRTVKWIQSANISAKASVFAVK